MHFLNLALLSLGFLGPGVLWFVFTGLYSVLFGPVYYLLFPTLFGGSETSSSGSGAPVIGIGDSQASSPQFVGTISDFATQPPAVNSSLSGQTSGSTSSNKIEAQCCVEGTKITTPTGIIAPVQPPNPGSVTVVITTPPLPPPTGQAPPPSPTHVPTVPTLTIESGTSTAPPHPLSSVPTPSATSPAPTQRPISTFTPTQVPTTGLGTIGTSTLGSTQDRLGPFVHFSSLLHTCLSLGGSKKACAAQASLYAQVLKVPITNEILQQSLVAYNPKPPIKSVTKPYPGTHSKPYLSAKPPSTVHLLPPHGKPFVHYQVTKPSNMFPSYSVSNQYREKVPPLKKREFSKLLTQLNQHPDHWKNIKIKNE